MDSLEKLIFNQFGIKVQNIKKLSGYDNVNYLVKSDEGKFIFKSYLYSREMEELVESENTILLHLNTKLKGKIPNPIPFTDGEYSKIIEFNSDVYIFRMLNYMEGDFMGDVYNNSDINTSLGKLLASIDTELLEYNDYILKSRVWNWDLQYLHLSQVYTKYIFSHEHKKIVLYFMQQFREKVDPIKSELRKSVIYNDANEWNVLIQNGSVSGLIDFGDLAHSFLINELAVAILCCGYRNNNILGAAKDLIGAYSEVLKLEENELSVLYYLIAARLCVSLCNSQKARVEDPDNEYAWVSEKYVLKSIHYWVSVNPLFAENIFREAAGYKPKVESNPIELKERRDRVISTALSTSYREPIFMDRAAFQYMFDGDGNTYLDAYNNIPHVGHNHPEVVEAGQRQMAKLNTNTRYLYNLLPEYAERLLAKFPKKLNKVFFVNSGSAASDLAYRLAKTHTKRDDFMVMEHGYHGNTQIGIEISDYKFSKKNGLGQQSNIIKLSIPDTYRGIYYGEGAGTKYAQDAANQLNSSVAGFIAEPIVGCGGQLPLAQGYLKEIYDSVRKSGGVCISDEVQTGFGRMGDTFWGFELYDVVPDIVILGKPMGNGHPMGAVVTTDEIAESFDNGIEFFSSFGGNPVSCAIGLSVLEVIEKEGLQEKAKIVGDYYQMRLRELAKKYDCIGDVRGSGLFIGIDIVKNTETKEPDTNLAALIKNEMKEKFILMSTDGPFDNVIKSKPPLCFTEENVDKVVFEMEEILRRNR